jgi:23S rRNA (uracil1939-C5)-methyltransferase
VGSLADGRTVFVARSAPGDLVELADLRPAKRFARARIGRLLEPGSERVTPPCPHYEADRCGGCQLQHLSETAQRDARRRILGDALRRIARLDLADPELEPSPRAWEYRTRITLTAQGTGPRGPGTRHLGYHRLHEPDRVFDLLRCPLAVPELNAVWSSVREAKHALPPTLTRLVLRRERHSGGYRVHVVVRTGPGDAWTGASALGRALEAARTPAVIWWQPEAGAPRAMYGSSTAYPVAAFEQVHPEMAERVRAYALGELGPVEGRAVWDLYAGTGDASRALAARGATVESVERDARAVRAAERLGEPAGITRHAMPMAAAAGRLAPAWAALVNPPRTGLDPELTDRLVRESLAGGVVYQSCDPATLARDLTRLRSAYQVTRVRAFDFFPQTAHVETVVTLAPAPLR